MNVAMAPWPFTGYGQAPGDVHTAPVTETDVIWYTPETFSDPEDAAEAAVEYAGKTFLPQGYTVTGVGFEVLTLDPETEVGTYRGWIMFDGGGPPGSVAFGKETPWWYYALSVGGGLVVGLISGALLMHAAK
jgi:hypothetical protein